MRRFRKLMLGFFLIMGLLALTAFFVLRLPPFGGTLSGTRLERIQRSPNYRDGAFGYPETTPVMDPDASYITMIREYLSPVPGREPDRPLPSVRTDLRALPDGAPVVVWFGHSSYLIRIGGKNLLVDPVLGDRAAPFAWLGSSPYAGSDVYRPEDLPPLDAVILTHDHYDHLSYATIQALIPKAKHFHAALGVGAHLARWGVPADRLTEYDWNESGTLADSLRLTAVPARHFSGRGLKRNQTLWTSYVLEAPGFRIFLGGDSGYGPHFREIGERFGPFDLALLEAGQYDRKWPLIHLMPEETVQAAADLRARRLLPVHWGKFTLGLHPWTEPIERVVKKADALGVPLATPRIGEPVVLGGTPPRAAWWRFSTKTPASHD
jgi:L-ascorbate metabolism protein UlaG (beta-lactamase superfamily)